MTNNQLPTACTNVACEPEHLPIRELYTPMTREEWERNMAIYEKVLESVGIGE